MSQTADIPATIQQIVALGGARAERRAALAELLTALAATTPAAVLGGRALRVMEVTKNPTPVEGSQEEYLHLDLLEGGAVGWGLRTHLINEELDPVPETIEWGPITAQDAAGKIVAANPTRPLDALLRGYSNALQRVLKGRQAALEETTDIRAVLLRLQTTD